MNYRSIYRKKKRRALHITIISLIVVGGLYLNMVLPALIRNSVPRVDVIFPERTEYTPSVTCSGTVEYSEVKSVREEMPLIIKEYPVNVGDRVDQGQTIAIVDKDAVCEMLVGMYAGSVSDALTFAELADSVPQSIESPVSGTVCALAASGELINAGADIAQIGGKGALVLNVAVPERNLTKIKSGQTAKLSVSSAEETLSGKVLKISKSTRKQYLGSVEETVADVTVSIDDPSEKLKSGDNGYAEIQTGIKRNIVTLPYSAVMQDDKSEYVYVIEDGRAVMRDVVTGLEMAKVTQVFGVSVEEEVVKDTTGVAANAVIMRNRKDSSDSGNISAENGKTMTD